MLAGDHCQLPPTIHSVEAAEGGLADTLFAKLIRKLGDKAARLLTVQYRMNTRIMTWASKEFYEGKLEAHDTVAKHLLYGIRYYTRLRVFLILSCSDLRRDANGPLILRVPAMMIDTSQSEMPESKDVCSVFSFFSYPLLLVQEEGESIANEGEAKVVVKHVQNLLNAGVEAR